MDVRLLGPVEASVDGRPVPLGAGKPRAVLALLALHAGSTVSSDRLIDGLWGERPPATAMCGVSSGSSPAACRAGRSLCVRGPALDDVSGEPFAAAEIRRLEELR